MGFKKIILIGQTARTLQARLPNYHLVRAYNKTYLLPTIITNCSNNYGPLQFPEKLIPMCINNAINGKDIPIYGNGLQIRDWLYVKDHCSAIRTVLESGRIGKVTILEETLN